MSIKQPIIVLTSDTEIYMLVQESLKYISYIKDSNLTGKILIRKLSQYNETLYAKDISNLPTYGKLKTWYTLSIVKDKEDIAKISSILQNSVSSYNRKLLLYLHNNDINKEVISEKYNLPIIHLSQTLGTLPVSTPLEPNIFRDKLLSLLVLLLTDQEILATLCQLEIPSLIGINLLRIPLEQYIEYTTRQLEVNIFNKIRKNTYETDHTNLQSVYQKIIEKIHEDTASLSKVETLISKYLLSNIPKISFFNLFFARNRSKMIEAKEQQFERLIHERLRDLSHTLNSSEYNFITQSINDNIDLQSISSEILKTVNSKKLSLIDAIDSVLKTLTDYMKQNLTLTWERRPTYYIFKKTTNFPFNTLGITIFCLSVFLSFLAILLNTHASFFIIISLLSIFLIGLIDFIVSFKTSKIINKNRKKFAKEYAKFILKLYDNSTRRITLYRIQSVVDYLNKAKKRAEQLKQTLNHNMENSRITDKHVLEILKPLITSKSDKVFNKIISLIFSEQFLLDAVHDYIHKETKDIILNKKDIIINHSTTILNNTTQSTTVQYPLFDLTKLGIKEIPVPLKKLDINNDYLKGEIAIYGIAKGQNV